MKITFQRASKKDKAHIKRFYKSQRYNGGFKGLDICTIAIHENNIIASAIISALTPSNTQLLLHSLVTHNQFRYQKIASQLIEYMLNIECASLPKNQEGLFCFADVSLERFYQRLGFEKDEVDSLNNELNARYKAYLASQPNLHIFKFCL